MEVEDQIETAFSEFSPNAESGISKLTTGLIHIIG